MSLLPHISFDNGLQSEYLVELWSGDFGSTQKEAIFILISTPSLSDHQELVNPLCYLKLKGSSVLYRISMWHHPRCPQQVSWIRSYWLTVKSFAPMSFPHSYNFIISQLLRRNLAYSSRYMTLYL